MLILFDIDLTLVRSSGAGLAAMVEAASAVLGRPVACDGLDTAGRLDPLILGELLKRNGVDATPELMASVRAAYTKAVPARLAGRAEALPGTHTLVARLARTDATLGVLTGNFEETGLLKLSAAGFDPAVFRVRVWGDSSPTSPPSRDHLPPVGIAQFERLHRRRPSETVIVGDTPHDVACGLACGCRVLAVATGRTDARTLAAAGAHRVVADLSDTEDIAAWLTGA